MTQKHLQQGSAMRQAFYVGMACMAAVLITGRAAPRAEEDEVKPKRALLDVLRAGQDVEIWIGDRYPNANSNSQLDNLFTVRISSPEDLEAARRLRAEHEELERQRGRLTRKADEMTAEELEQSRELERKQLRLLTEFIQSGRRPPVRIIEVGSDFVACLREWPGKDREVICIPRERIKLIERPLGMDEPSQK